MFSDTEELHSIFNTIPCGIFILDSEWKFSYLNKLFETLFGLKKSDLMAQNIWDKFPEMIGGKLHDELYRSFSLQLHIVVECYSTRLGRWIEYHTHPMPESLIVYCRDIHDKKRTETPFETMFYHNLSAMFLSTVPDGKIFQANPAFFKLFECKAAEVLDHKVTEIGLLNAEEYHSYKELLIKNGQLCNLSLCIHTKANSVKDITLSCMLFTINDSQIVLNSIHDITELVQARSNLLRDIKLLDLTPDMVIGRNMDNQVIFWNRSAEIHYGWKKEEAIGQLLHHLFKTEYPSPYDENKIMAHLIANDCWEGELTHIGKDQRKICVRSRQILQRDLLGAPVAILETASDITRQKEHQREMARLSALNIVGQIASSIGHEIRNPMTTVRGYLQYLMKNDTSERGKASFMLMIEELDRANSIISEFLSIAKDNHVTFKTININDIIEKIKPLLEAQALETGKQVVFLTDIVPDSLLEENQIRQVILNLVKNGLEASPDGMGSVIVRTKKEENCAILEVQDNGQGIPRHILAEIGKPFFTTKETGTGLGLAVCYSIASRHNAQLLFDTGSRGTTFSLKFPAI